MKEKEKQRGRQNRNIYHALGVYVEVRERESWMDGWMDGWRDSAPERPEQ